MLPLVKPSVVSAGLLLLVLTGEAIGAGHSASANDVMPGCRSFIAHFDRHAGVDSLVEAFREGKCAGAVWAVSEIDPLPSEGLGPGPVYPRRRPIHRQPTSKAARKLP
jgi:hypothetical protein